MNRSHLALALLLATSACAPRASAPAAAVALPSSAPATAPAPSSPAKLVAAPPADDPERLREALLKPEDATASAPDNFKVVFTTTKGDFVVEVTRAWAPRAADRFYNLVKRGFMHDIGFFRVVPNFVVQFGIHGDPKVAAAWRHATIKDDPKGMQSNSTGTVTFAKSGPDTSTTQLFINYRDNSVLDSMGFNPFGKVVLGMDVVESINAEYGEQPQQPLMQSKGNAYLMQAFPRLDYVKSAALVE